jgi:hypothetical protein
VSKKEKSPKYRCDSCGKGIDSRKALIKHYRKDHPEASDVLWNAIGTTGDMFADTLIENISIQSADARRSAFQYESNIKELEKANVELRFKVDQLSNSASAIQLILSNTAQAVN